jgi:cell division protein ZapA (FtsZ GTPase activity inhibitor)
MTERHAVKVVIGGEEYTVRSELPPEYTREVAAFYDASLRRVRQAAPALEPHKAAILAGLAVADELFRARRDDAEAARRVSALAEVVARCLPPARRGGRGRTATSPD